MKVTHKSSYWCLSEYSLIHSWISWRYTSVKLCLHHIVHTEWIKHHSAKPSVHCMNYLLSKLAASQQKNLDSELHVLLWTGVTTRMDIAHNYVMRSSTTTSTTCARSAESQEACLLACYDQWWVSHVVGAIANCIHSLRWKEAISVSFVPQEFVRKQGKEGSGSQQMTPKLLNKAFSAKAT